MIAPIIFKTGNIRETAVKIDSFRALQNGWRFGDGVALSADVLRQAAYMNLYMAMAGFARTNAFPLVSGGVRVTAYQGDYYLEFSIEPSGLVNYLFELSDIEQESAEGISLAEANKIIRDFRSRLWVTSDLSTILTSTMMGAESKALPSNAQVMEAVSQLLTKIVPYELAGHFVNISPDFTQLSPQSYSGNYLKMLFRRTASSFQSQATPAIPAITIS